MVRTNQGGSILGFTIIGGVMALLLVGGAYFVRKSFSPSDRNGEVVTTQSNDDESTGTSEDEPEETEVTNNGSDQGENDSESVFQRTDNDVIPQTGQESTAPDNLPQTGPADTLLTGLFLGSIVGAATAYTRSRNTASSL